MQQESRGGAIASLTDLAHACHLEWSITPPFVSREASLGFKNWQSLGTDTSRVLEEGLRPHQPGLGVVRFLDFRCAGGGRHAQRLVEFRLLQHRAVLCPRPSVPSPCCALLKRVKVSLRPYRWPWRCSPLWCNQELPRSRSRREPMQCLQGRQRMRPAR